MKKLYSIFLVMMLAVVGALSVQAAPSSLKFKIQGDATNVKISWPGGDPVEIVDGECTVTPPNAAMPIFLQTEPDEMTNITASDGSNWWDTRAGAPAFPLNSYTVFLSNIGAGVEYLTIEINGAGGGEVVQPTDKTIYVHGPEQLAVKFGPGYVDRTDADGWAISVSPMNRLDLQVEVQSAYVNSYEISGLKLNGEAYELDHDGQIAFIDVYKLVDFADGDVLDVEVKEKGGSEEPEVINGFKLVIDGNAENIQVMNPFAMGTFLEFTNNAYTFDAMPTNVFPVMLQNDAKITNVTADDDSPLWRAGYGPSFPIEGGWTIDPSYINKGATVTIELDGQGGAVVEPVSKTVYVSGPEQLSVKLGEGEIARDEAMNRWEVKVDPTNRLELRVQVKPEYAAQYEITGSYLNGDSFVGSGASDDLNLFVDEYTLNSWVDGSVLNVLVSERVVEPEPVVVNGFKLVIDGNAENIQVMNPFAMGTYIEFVDNAYTFNEMPKNSFPVFLQNDAKITNITADDNSALWRAGYGPEFPIENMWTIDPSYINKGATVTIELDGQGGAVVEPTAKTIYVSGPEQLSVKLGESELVRDESMNRWAITLEPANRLELRVQVQQQYAAQYKISGSYLNGEPFAGTGASDDLNLFVDDYTLGEWEDGSVLSVTVAERTAQPGDISFNVNIIGDASKVSLRYFDGSGNIALDGNENEVFCSPDNNQLVFEHVAFGSSLYNVEVDGEGTVAQQGTKWLYQAKDGDIVTVTVEAAEPAAGEPVTFAFVNDGTDGAIMNALVNGANVEWNTPGFTLPKGTILDVQFDIYNYDIKKVTCNGNDVTAKAVAGSYSVTVPEGGVSFVVDAQVKAPVQVTFNVVGDPAGVQYAYGWSCSDATVLTSSPQVVSVPSEYAVINVCSMPGYVIDKIEASNGATYSNDSFIEVKDGDVYTVYVTKEASAGSVMVYVQETSWVYLKLGWNLNMGNAEKSYEFGKNLSTGYAEVDYVNNGQFSVTGYPAPIVYVNNEDAEVWNPTHEWKIYDAFNMQPLNPGDVVKVFRALPQSFDVTYDIDSEVPVKVYHDKVRHMENPGVHSEFHGTEICIKPDAEMQAFALNASEIKVTVNDNAVTANEAGEYVINVTDHMTVKVAKAGDAVDSIVSDSNDNDEIYNLQGIKVSAKNLPAGVYIKGGKKILVK